MSRERGRDRDHDRRRSRSRDDGRDSRKGRDKYDDRRESRDGYGSSNSRRDRRGSSRGRGGGGGDSSASLLVRNVSNILCINIIAVTFFYFSCHSTSQSTRFEECLIDMVIFVMSTCLKTFTPGIQEF